MTIADAFITRSGTMLLGMVGDTRGAGIYSLSFSMAMLVALPRVAVNTMFAPTVAHLHASGDAKGLQAMLVKASGLSLAGALMVAIPLWLSLDLLLSWLGAEFHGAREIVSILVLGQVFAAAAGPQEDLFTMTGNERAGAGLLVASALAVFILGYILIGRYAETGAAIAASLVLIGWNIGMALVIHRQIGLVPGLIMGLRELIRNGQKNPGL
jgi:O-antigen/teichoic acid export membrane protein